MQLDLCKIAEKHDDPQMQDFLEQNYLHEQLEAIKELGDYMTNLKVRSEHGEWHFDKELCNWVMVWQNWNWKLNVIIGRQ